jgi:hypothetical protein
MDAFETERQADVDALMKLSEYLVSIKRRTQESTVDSAIAEIKRLRREVALHKALFIHTAGVLAATAERFGSHGDEETEMIEYWHERMRKEDDRYI